MYFSSNQNLLVCNNNKITSNHNKNYETIPYPVLDLNLEKGHLFNLPSNTSLINLNNDIYLDKDTFVYKSRGKHKVFNCPSNIFNQFNFTIANCIAAEFITAARNIFFSSTQWRTEHWQSGKNFNFRCSLQDDAIPETAPPTIYSKILKLNKYYFFVFTYSYTLKKAFLYVDGELQASVNSDFIPLFGGLIYLPFPGQWIKVAYLKYWNDYLNENQVLALSQKISKDFKSLLES